MKYSTEITNYVQTATNEQKPLLEELRQLIHEVVPGTSEAIKWGFPVFAKSKDFAYLRFSKKHITLGFYNIDKIDDPEKKLEGTGNTLRHIKIKKREDIDVVLISKWLKSISE